MRCIDGDFGYASECKEKTFSLGNSYGVEFCRALAGFVREGKVGFMVQCAHYGKLLERRFGEGTEIRNIGLWTADWDEMWESRPFVGSQDRSPDGFDVVFHGQDVPAKGADWARELAKECDEYSFFFPMEKKPGEKTGPGANFVDMEWDTGLKEMVKSARLVLVPSLWSAPIESALIKSLWYGKNVAVVENKTSFSNDIPDDIVLKLPLDIKQAAFRLREYFEGRWVLDDEKKSKWLEGFLEGNRGLLDRILKATLK
ncbi:MAG: hypothetical protein V1754_08580 [Pseudomonadota bacterium]